MKITYICKNTSCLLSCLLNISNQEEKIPASIECPICHSQMEPDKAINWMEKIAGEEKKWAEHAENVYPSVIAYEYRRLRGLCREKKAYGVQICLKDNFETLLKFEVLLAYAWAAQNMDESFFNKTISQITTQNPSFGTWVDLAGVMLRDLKTVGQALPGEIPLEKIYHFFQKHQIVGWRNTKLGHGAMELEEDDEFQKDIIEKIGLLKDAFLLIDRELRNQRLWMLIDSRLSEKNDMDKRLLMGTDMARQLNNTGEVFLQMSDEGKAISLYPYIVIRKHEKRGYGIYFFDNQKTLSLSHFIAYSEGSRKSEAVGYFEKLRRKLEEGEKRLGALANDQYLSDEDLRELDLVQMSHEYISPVHIKKWLKDCISKHKKGVFLLCAERGMGKSVFAEKINRLYKKPEVIDDDLDVRTYHFSRMQSAGASDICKHIEGMWRKQYQGPDWERMPQFAEYEKNGASLGDAFCDFMGEVRNYTASRQGCSRVLMVLDGLDEITDEKMWEFVPDSSKIPDGVYVLLTSRDKKAEKLPGTIASRLQELSEKATETYTVNRISNENHEFLLSYIKNTKLTCWSKEHQEKLLEMADHRVLYLGMLCRLAEAGMAFEELPEKDKVVAKYLEELEERYSDRNAISLRELISVLSTLGTLEPVNLFELGELTSENGVTLKLMGMIRDIAPMLKIIRGDKGNCYAIANLGLAKEMARQVPETEDTVREFLQIAVSLMKEGSPVNKGGMSIVVSHVVELALYWLPEQILAFEEDFENVIEDYLATYKTTAHDSHAEAKIADCWRQLFLYRLQVTSFAKENPIPIYKKNTDIFADILTYIEELCRRPLSPENLLFIADFYEMIADYLNSYPQAYREQGEAYVLSYNCRKLRMLIEKVNPEIDFSIGLNSSLAPRRDLTERLKQFYRDSGIYEITAKRGESINPDMDYSYNDPVWESEELLLLSISIKSCLLKVDFENYKTTYVNTLLLIASLWIDLNAYAKALDILDIIPKLFALNSADADQRISVKYFLLVYKASRGLRRFEKVNDCLQKLVKLYDMDDLPLRDRTELCLMLVDIAEHTRDVREAAIYFKKLINLLERIPKKQLTAQLTRCLLECCCYMQEITALPAYWNPDDSLEYFQKVRQLGKDNFDTLEDISYYLSRSHLSRIALEDSRDAASINTVVSLITLACNNCIRLLQQDSDASEAAWAHLLSMFDRFDKHMHKHASKEIKAVWMTGCDAIIEKAMPLLKEIGSSLPLSFIPHSYRETFSDFALMTGEVDTSFIQNYKSVLYRFCIWILVHTELWEYHGDRYGLTDFVEVVYGKMVKCQTQGYPFQIYNREFKDISQKIADAYQ